MIKLRDVRRTVRRIPAVFSRKEFWQDVHLGVEFEVYEFHLGHATHGMWVRSFFSTLGTRFAYLWCELVGHRWQVESWANPESGGDSFECKRCGAGHYIPYY